MFGNDLGMLLAQQQQAASLGYLSQINQGGLGGLGLSQGLSIGAAPVIDPNERLLVLLTEE